MNTNPTSKHLHRSSPVLQDEEETVVGDSCDQPSQTLATNSFPCRIGDYELLGEIARGNMGVIYRARQIPLNRIVALKMILPERLESNDGVKRFQVEAEAVAQLCHPHIVPIYEVGDEDGYNYYSMQLINGTNLSLLLVNGPLAAREAARLLIPIAEAVEYAHRIGVIHRDLKPANILIDQDGKPWVTDFGVAKVSRDGDQLTLTGEIVGTPSFMSPEQVEGRSENVNAEADVYSIGAILYAMLVGHPPFKSANPTDTMLQVLEKEPIRPRRLDPRIPLDIETIALKCLSKKPNHRYRSAKELADELRRFIDDVPILARRISGTEEAIRWVRRHPIHASAIAGAAATFIGLVLMVGMFLLPSSSWKPTTIRYEFGPTQDRFSLQIDKQRLIFNEFELANSYPSAKGNWRTGPQLSADELSARDGLIVTIKVSKVGMQIEQRKGGIPGVVTINIESGGYLSASPSKYRVYVSDEGNRLSIDRGHDVVAVDGSPNDLFIVLPLHAQFSSNRINAFE